MGEIALEIIFSVAKLDYVTKLYDQLYPSSEKTRTIPQLLLRLACFFVLISAVNVINILLF